jgi:hypothetical protein
MNVNKLKDELILLESKFGGLIQGVERNVFSNYEITSQLPGELLVSCCSTLHQGGDRMSSLYHNYAEYYAENLIDYVKQTSDELNIVEIGILKGSGLGIWCEIFPKDTIYGLDIDINNFLNNYENLKNLGAFKKNYPIVESFDQFLDNRNKIKNLLNGKKVDIVIDDGCHLDYAILNTFKYFRDFLNDKFVYFIEDNINVYKELCRLYPEYNIYYNDEMTIIKST